MAPPLRVLIVDDDSDVLRVFYKAIGSQADTILAMNVAMAKECLKDREIDVLLTDYNLPDATGVDLVIWLAAFDPSVRRVLMTAGVLPQLEPGLCHAVLSKPATIAEMRRAVLGSPGEAPRQEKERP